MIKQIGLPLRGRPMLLITRMITDQIGLHSVPITIIYSKFNNARIFIGSRLLSIKGQTHRRRHHQKLLIIYYMK